MLKLLRTVALALTAGLGLAAALPTAASAEGIYFGIGDGGARFGVVPADDDGWGRRDRDERDGRREWRGHDRRDGWRRGGGYRCATGRALDKAERLGLRRAYVRDAGRDTIRISGRRHGDRITLTFGRAPYCPIVGI